MIFRIPEIELFEAVATVQLLLAATDAVTMGAQGEALTLIDAACLPWNGLDDDTLDASDRMPSPVQLAYGDAMRKIDKEENRSYHELLLACSLPLLSNDLHSINIDKSALAFPQIKPTGEKCIVMCPFGLRRELDLPVRVWRHIALFLRSYNLRLYLMGSRGERMDQAVFTESEILSEETMQDKLAILALSSLVVGVPNGWTWLATAWTRNMVILYPDGMPPRRWFPYIHDRYGRILFEAHNLQVPIVLAGLRKLIKDMPDAG